MTEHRTEGDDEDTHVAELWQHTVLQQLEKHPQGLGYEGLLDRLLLAHPDVPDTEIERWTAWAVRQLHAQQDVLLDGVDAARWDGAELELDTWITLNPAAAQGL